MKEIKFKFYDKEEKLTYFSDDFGSLGEFFIFKETYYKNCELNEYTGLKYNNGKEIYKGDILHDFSDELPMIVEWDEILACFKLCARINGCLEFEYKVYEIHLGGLEVIGNIYENPELLEVK